MNVHQSTLQQQYHRLINEENFFRILHAQLEIQAR